MSASQREYRRLQQIQQETKLNRLQTFCKRWNSLEQPILSQTLNKYIFTCPNKENRNINKSGYSVAEEC